MKYDLLEDFTLKRIYSNNQRYYLSESHKKYMSVTTMLNKIGAAGINEWKLRVGEEEAKRISTEAATFGTAVHAQLENFLLMEPLDETVTEEVKVASNNIIAKMSAVDNIRGIEHRLYSDRLCLAGTTDLVAEYEGLDSVVDFKTSGKPKKEEWILAYFLQSTAYALMLLELYGIQIKQIVLIIAVRDGTVQVFKKNPIDYIDQLIYYNNKYNPLYGNT